MVSSSYNLYINQGFKERRNLLHCLTFYLSDNNLLHNLAKYTSYMSKNSLAMQRTCSIQYVSQHLERYFKSVGLSSDIYIYIYMIYMIYMIYIIYIYDIYNIYMCVCICIRVGTPPPPPPRSPPHLKKRRFGSQQKDSDLYRTFHLYRVLKQYLKSRFF